MQTLCAYGISAFALFGFNEPSATYTTFIKAASLKAAAVGVRRFSYAFLLGIYVNMTEGRVVRPEIFYVGFRYGALLGEGGIQIGVAADKIQLRSVRDLFLRYGRMTVKNIAKSPTVYGGIQLVYIYAFKLFAFKDVYVLRKALESVDALLTVKIVVAGAYENGDTALAELSL